MDIRRALGRVSGVGLEVLMTLSEDEMTDPVGLENLAGAAFDELLDRMSRGGDLDPVEDNESVFLLEGHVCVFDGTAVHRVKSFPMVRDAVCKLARTGAAKDAGPPRNSGDVPDGEWLFSLRTGRWRLEAAFFVA